MTSKSILNSLLTTGATVIVTVVAIILTTQVTGPLPLSLTQTISQKETLFSVTGESEITAVPDEAQISLGIDAYQDTIAAAQDQANTTINSLQEELKKLGVKDEDLKTQNYSINPEYDYTDAERQLIGYRVSTSLRVKFHDFTNLGQAIDLATQLGANQIGGISFTLSTDQEKQLQKQARQEAIEQAKENARELSSLSGIRLGRIVDIQEGRGNTAQPNYRQFDMAAAALEEAAPTQIEPGSSSYNYTVTLSYETL